jgi:hypothetical protein
MVADHGGAIPAYVADTVHSVFSSLISALPKEVTVLLQMQKSKTNNYSSYSHGDR